MNCCNCNCHKRMTEYTVEWGHYQWKNGRRISQIQDGDKEYINASSKEDAIKKAPVPKDVEWYHAYIGPSKWG